MGKIKRAALVLGSLASGLTGCGDPSVAGSEAQDTPPPAGVRFVVVAESRLFAPGSELRARLWNAEQLDALRANSQCSISTDPNTGTQDVQCPEGVTYQDVVAEEFAAPVAGPVIRLEFQTEKVRVGEEFRLVASGRSADGCNSTSSERSDRADSSTITLDELVWETTLRACATG